MLAFFFLVLFYLLLIKSVSIVNTVESDQEKRYYGCPPHEWITKNKKLVCKHCANKFLGD